MRTHLNGLLFLISSLFLIIANADDAVESVSSGSITFEKNNNIRMLDETLTKLFARS